MRRSPLRTRVRDLALAALLALAAAGGPALVPSAASALPEGCREVLAPDRASGQMRKRVVCPEASSREERLERRVRELERRERRRSARETYDPDGPTVILVPSERRDD